MKKIITGIIIGSVLSLSATALAEPIKEYVLTKIKYPVIVDGLDYKNEELPVLNYEGNTYVPLKALGDLLGVEVKWHEDLRVVEINKNKIEQEVNDKHENNKEETKPEIDERQKLKIGDTFTNGDFSIKLLSAYKMSDQMVCNFNYENSSVNPIENYTNVTVNFNHNIPKMDKTIEGELWFSPKNNTVYEYPAKQKGYVTYKFVSELEPSSITLKGKDGNDAIWSLSQKK